MPSTSLRQWNASARFSGAAHSTPRSRIRASKVSSFSHALCDSLTNSSQIDEALRLERGKARPDRGAVTRAFTTVRPGLVIHAGYARDEASIVEATRHIAAGAAVTWNRPKASFIMPSQRMLAAYQPGILAGLPFDLEEWWQP